MSEVHKSDDIEDAVSMMKEAIDRDPGYTIDGQSPFGRGQKGKSRNEEEHARVASITIAKNHEKQVVSVKMGERPDARITLNDGTRIGVEVTELVDAKVAECLKLRILSKYKYIKPEKVAVEYEVALWDVKKIEASINKIISKKDVSPYTINDGPYDFYVILVITDEPGIYNDLIENIVNNEYKTNNIDDIYILMGYDPRYEDKFPESRPIFRLRARK